MTSTRWLDFCDDDDADSELFSGSGIGTIQWTLHITHSWWQLSVKIFEGWHFRIRIREFFKPNFTSAEWAGCRNCVQSSYLLVRALQSPNASTLFCLFLLWESDVTQWQHAVVFDSRWHAYESQLLLAMSSG